MTYKSTPKISIIIDKETGEPKRVKHLNQVRIDRCYAGTPPGKWNKTGKKKRSRKGNSGGIGSMRSNSPKFRHGRLWKNTSELQTKFDVKVLEA